MSASMEHAFAVVESVETDGLRLRFDGEESAGEKKYKCNTFYVFQPGDRVYCVRDSGTFVAICKIGAPAEELGIEVDSVKYAETAGTAKTAETAGTSEYAEGLVDYSAGDYFMAVRESLSYGIFEYAMAYKGQMGAYIWFPLGCPIDEAVTYPGATAIVRFRSTSGGKLQFCMPYRDPYTWYTVATE